MDDRGPVPQLLEGLLGSVYGDKGYISQQLMETLMKTLGIRLVKRIKRRTTA